MRNPFTAHPASVGEGYFEHMASALGVWVRLFLATTVVFIHAFLPFLFPETGSSILKQLLYERDRPHKRGMPAKVPDSDG
jgi:hypothetical protein